MIPLHMFLAALRGWLECEQRDVIAFLREENRALKDRDRKWSRTALEFLEREGVRIVRTPFRSPNCNAYAERFVRSIKEECLNRVIPLGERHLRRTIGDFVAHYHGERNHQGIGNELIEPVGQAKAQGPVRRRQRMGGILNYYYRAA